MGEHKFNNEYHMILCALSLSPDRFESENLLFAAQCIWWVASIIQFTEILIYYHNNPVLPWEYINDLVVLPLLNPRMAESRMPESEIPVLNIKDSDTEAYSGRSDLLPNYLS